MKLIVGLGNPGEEYRYNRHNFGSRALESLALDGEIKLKSDKCSCSFEAKAKFGNEKAVLAVPNTFMNLSGIAVRALAVKYEVALEDILVVFDDITVPLGSMRFKKEGGSGGHNGIKSVIACLGSSSFPRLRLGIGPEHGLNGDLSDFVLSDFSAKEEKIALTVIENALLCMKLWLESGSEAAMNRYNMRHPAL